LFEHEHFEKFHQRPSIQLPIFFPRLLSQA
jgi:hypothetical protein